MTIIILNETTMVNTIIEHVNMFLGFFQEVFFFNRKQRERILQ
jgi:hypothetical protein